MPQRDFFGIPGAKSPVQDPVYLLGTRDYQHGRPAKYIHWKASARRGHVLGLMTNGFIEGKESSLVPIARNNQQLPAILEVLARLQMKPRLRLTDAVRRGINVSWGLSCVCFFYQEDRTIGIMREYFKRTKIPAVFLSTVLPFPQIRIGQ